MSALRSSAQIARRKTAFGYNSIEDTTRRRKPTTRATGEAFYFTPRKRETAAATVREDRRNFGILAWMVRRHLDNVSRFTAHIRTGDDNLDAIIRKVMDWHGRRANFDATGRHGRDEWMRMFEACKVIDGDAAGLKTQGIKLQGIEGTRIARPPDTPKGASAKLREQLKSVTDAGLIKAGGIKTHYCLCSRTGERQDGMQFEALVPASAMVFDGYWPERYDADRGVSPLLTSLNDGADVRETWEYLVLKAKASALFGLAFTRTSADTGLPTFGEQPTDAPASESAAYSQQVTDAVKARGLINIDLDPGDAVVEIESRTPNPQIVEFTRELIRSFLTALDIPFTFYDSLSASFSARIADRNEYEEACEWKRDKNVDVLNDVYAWALPLLVEVNKFGLRDALAKAGRTVDDLLASLEWVPAGKPWLDRAGEMSGHILALAAGVDSIPRIAARYGLDAYQLAAEQKKFIETSGIPLLYAQGGQFSVQSLMDGAKGKDNGTQDQGK
jgi:capsid protein